MTISRAYSLLEVKEWDDDKRELRGVATSPEPDRMGDVVEPMGVSFKNPLPLLWQHDATKPVGTVEFDKPTKNGITFRAKLAKIDEPGTLKDRIDEAWQSVKAKLVRGVSIGFRSLEHAYMKDTGGIHFLKSEVMELSLVTIPANAAATIQSLKSFDLKQRASSGNAPPEVTKPPRTGTPNQPAESGFFSARMKGVTSMQTLTELREMRETKAARLGELATLFKAADHNATADETAEFDSLKGDIDAIDRDIRVKEADLIIAGRATRVPASPASPAFSVKKADPEDKFKGQSFTRLLIAKARSHLALKSGDFVPASVFAEQMYGKTHPNLVRFIKAGVAGGGTESGEWGAELAMSDTKYMGDFIEFLYSKTVFDSLPLRSVPKNVHIKGQDGAATGFWVGESRGIPATTLDFSDVELRGLKVASITACSRELLEDSTPAAEMLIRDGLAEALAQRVDTTFLGAGAASSGVSPAGLLNGVSAFQPSGADAAAIRADFQSLAVPFLDAKNGRGLVHVMRPELAMAMGMLVNALGQTEFPTITEDGGTLFGRPVYTGDNVTDGNWIVLKPSDIWKIGNGGIRITMSDTATIEQDTAPTGRSDTPVAASASIVSMFSTDSVAFRVVRDINYAKRRTGVVQYIENAEYGGVVS